MTKKAGRPKKVLTPDQVEQVEKLAGVLTQEQIADFLGITDRTLRNRMAEDPAILSAYEKGKSRAIAGVAKNLIQQAHDGNVTAAIFYLKTQAGWKETQGVEVTGKNGDPIEIRQMSTEEIERRVAQIKARVLASAIG